MFVKTIEGYPFIPNYNALYKVVNVKASDIYDIKDKGTSVLVKHRQTETYETPKGKYEPDLMELKERRGFAKRFPTVEKRVAKILREDEYARKNYLWLLLRYYAMMSQIKIIIPQENFSHANSPETISRAFRSVMKKARLGDPKLKKLVDKSDFDRRLEEEQEVRGYFRQEKHLRNIRKIK